MHLLGYIFNHLKIPFTAGIKTERDFQEFSKLQVLNLTSLFKSQGSENGNPTNNLWNSDLCQRVEWITINLCLFTDV